MNAPTDTLRRDDMNPAAPAPVKRAARMMWAVRLGDGSGSASPRLFTATEAKRFVRLAKRFGLDVYAVRFGKVSK